MARTGPFTSNISTWTYYRYSSTYKSTLADRSRPSPYQMKTSRILRSEPFQAYGASGGRGLWYLQTNQTVARNATLVLNKAFGKLVDKARSDNSASLGETLAERRQAITMLTERARQLLRLARAVARRDLQGVLANISKRDLIIRGELLETKRRRTIMVGTPDGRSIRVSDFRQNLLKVRTESGIRVKAMSPSDRGKYEHIAVRDIHRSLEGKATRFADRWLEFHFGFAPLYDDMKSALDVLQGDISPVNITVKSSVKFSIHEANAGPSHPGDLYDFKVGVRAGVKLYLQSANLNLADQLGLVNPAAIAYATIPYSWLLDWMLPVSKFLNSFTDLIGYEKVDPYHTIYKTATGQTYQMAEPDKRNNYRVTESSAVMDRILSLPPYTLTYQPFKGLSAARGATAVSVLMQFLQRNRSPLELR